MKPKNPAVLRVAEFMSNYAPFSLIPKENVEFFAQHTEIIYLKKNSSVFKKGEPATGYLYLLEKGSVNIYTEEDKLSDTCAEGDIFGVRSVLSGNNFVLTAKTQEESFIYAIPGSLINDELKQNAELAAFFASGLAGGSTIIRSNFSGSQHGLFDELNKSKPSHLFRIQDLLELRVKNDLISVDPQQTIKEVAEIMLNKKVGSVIVTNKDLSPAGIFTDHDFRNVVASAISVDSRIETVMSSPVVTIKAEKMVSDLQQLMLEKGFHHVAITEDGTINSKVKTVISQKDLMLFEGDKPDVILRNIKIVESIEQLKNISENVSNLSHHYVKAEFPIDQVSKIITTLNDELTKKAIELALEETEDVPDKKYWCWFSLGSLGRKEQLIKTDQDNALIFKDSISEIEARALKNFAKKAVENLFQIGFEYCPANMMASNPKWNKSESEWNDIFRSWIKTPVQDALLHSTIFFDFRPIYGENDLIEILYNNINGLIERNESFLNHLAGNALRNPPPLSFFRKFIIEKSGEHKEMFDIKARALMPLVDAARVLAFSSFQNKATNTKERFEIAAEMDKKNAKLLNGAGEAHGFLLKLRAEFGHKNQDSGRYINPDQLNQFERTALKDCFKIINEIQRILEVRYNLGFLAK
ncbi:DUF294 nucleotidyltransferase-like domain-containing protein [Mangrovivirga cuniculi]|uniref:CBS domain-containing protein n=1 Tax=Mangrovivirga cuniculi TaxID=2715131 RepID=A0A4D7JQR8_9BACT|nr:DUF294 nucleotidyltransferase-like domain-containing protein [Mangrovivirga cuniculi]QCK15850.1 hypothetical protein DCC35_14400 [Mangrovivirga cuniculi]